MMMLLRVYNLFFKMILVTVLSNIFVVAVNAKEQVNQNHILETAPLIIMEGMTEFGCNPIRNFYENYMVMEPPFAWISYNDFVFVCEIQKKTNHIGYKMVIKTSQKEKYFSTCPNQVEMKGKPGGLTIGNKPILKDDYFSYLDSSPLISAPFGKITIISLSTGDGGFLEFACIKGKWFVHSYS